MDAENNASKLPPSMCGRRPVLLQKSREVVNGPPIHTRTSFVRLDSCQCLLAVLLLTDFLHQPFANGRAFGPALRQFRFGPSLEGRRGCTPTLLRKGQTVLAFLPLVGC